MASAQGEKGPLKTMKKTLFLHIGYHKTGTKSIQNFFWNNRFAFREKGLLYPELGLSGPTHAQFALSLPGERDKFAVEIASVDCSARGSSYEKYNGPTAHDLYCALGKVIEQTECTRILLSSECFLEWVSPCDIKCYVKDHCNCDVKIIVYLRRQDLWIQSVFNQVVKDPCLRYAGNLAELPQMSWLDYFSTLSGWADQFGVDNIIVRQYEESLKLNNGTISDILDVLELEERMNYQYPIGKVRNAGLTSWQFKILHLFNQKSAGGELFRLVLDLFERQNSKLSIGREVPLYLDYEKAKELYNSFLEGNMKIADKFLNGMVPFYPPSREEYGSLEQVELDEVAQFLIFVFSSGNIRVVK